jgi:hypothetical protein
MGVSGRSAASTDGPVWHANIVTLRGARMGETWKVTHGDGAWTTPVLAFNGVSVKDSCRYPVSAVGFALPHQLPPDAADVETEVDSTDDRPDDAGTRAVGSSNRTPNRNLPGGDLPPDRQITTVDDRQFDCRSEAGRADRADQRDPQPNFQPRPVRTIGRRVRVRATHVRSRPTRHGRRLNGGRLILVPRHALRQPGPEPPLGWTLAPETVDDMRSQLRATSNASQIEELRHLLNGGLSCGPPEAVPGLAGTHP